MSGTFKIEVWDLWDGDLVKVVWEGTDEDLAELEERYDDKFRYEIVTRSEP